jgi:hypothetical protein
LWLGWVAVILQLVQLESLDLETLFANDGGTTSTNAATLTPDALSEKYAALHQTMADTPSRAEQHAQTPGPETLTRG